MLARRPRILTVVLEGDMRRLSGQVPAPGFLAGSYPKLSPASQAARAHRLSQPTPAPPNNLPAGHADLARAAVTRASLPPQPRAKVSGQRDRPGEKAFSTASRARLRHASAGPHPGHSAEGRELAAGESVN